MESSRPRLAEVAALAGVSIATVSKVINGRPEVAEGTRRRVTAAIESTGYRSPVDRRESERPQVLAVLDGLDSAYSATILDGIIDAGTAHRVQIVVTFGISRMLRDDPRANLGWLMPPNCIGVINVEHDMQLPKALMDLPVVSIDPSAEVDPEWMTIGATNWTGAKAATQHLLDLGHRRIAWVGGTERSLSSDRLHGYRAALQSHGAPTDPSLERAGSYTFEFGRESCIELMTSADPPTAIACGNDEIAVGVINGAQSLGLGIPSDLSVTGYDDSYKAAWVSPRLTSVRQPLADMGRMAVSMVVSTVRGQAPELRHIQLTNQLVVRDTTAPPPSR